MQSEGEYVDGKEEGLWRDYHANGKLAAEGRYEAGNEEGLWRFFGDDGQEQTRTIYRAGVAQRVGNSR